MVNVKGAAYERVLHYFDENGDGKISPSELRNKMDRMGGDVVLLLDEVQAAIESLDRDGDGLLDLEDLVELLEGGSDEDKLKDLREAFVMYDVDNCGFITPSDLKKMLCRLGESKSIDECKLMISRFDLNGDGMLSFDEFKAMMQ